MRTALLASVVLGVAAPAYAHIHLTSPMARTDSLTGDQKEQHCGVANQVRNPARVSTYTPGQTLTVTWMETIQHPGYFRIAFQPDGQVFGIPPAGGGPGGFPTLNLEGVDLANQSIVLKDRIPDGMLSAVVTLPNMECANCTLQFIQVMTDKPPYTIDALSDDIYFNCADITLSNVPMHDAGTNVGIDAATGGPDAGVAPNPSTVDGGCSTGGGGSLASTALLLGMFALRRRRR